MACGLEQRQWDVADIVRLIEEGDPGGWTLWRCESTHGNDRRGQPGMPHAYRAWLAHSSF